LHTSCWGRALVLRVLCARPGQGSALVLSYACILGRSPLVLPAHAILDVIAFVTHPARKCCAASELEQLPEEDMLGFIAVQEESAADELGVCSVSLP
jgi:hypothetical protein